MDLSTKYLGLDLRCPVVASAGPLSQTVDGIKRLADSGLGAVVLYSLFEEQVRQEQAARQQLEEMYEDSFAEALSFFPSTPSADTSGGTIAQYLKLVEQGASAIDVPLIASLNGASHGGWVDVARQMQDAGAAAIELNVYFVPGDLSFTSTEVEQRHLDIVEGVKQAVTIPVAVKLSPFFSSFGHMAQALDAAGADGLVLFNRWLQPEIDIERMQIESGVELSHPAEGRLPRTWIAVLRNQVKASLAATSGVETADDVVRYILAGADVVMTTSALVRHGIDYASTLIAGLDSYLTRKELSLEAARGLLAVPADVPADSYERAGYVSALQKAKLRYGN